LPLGYQIVRKDRATRGEGVAILVKNCFKVNIIELSIEDWIANSCIEYLCISVQPVQNRNMKSIIVCCIYQPEVSANEIENLENLMVSLNESSKCVYILGDFNINMLSKNKKQSKIVSVLKRQDMRQLVSDSTRKDAVLDLIFTKNAHLGVH